MNDTGRKDLELKFDPRTIEHLGIKMYSQLPYALAELVANAYDASATNVEIKLYDNDTHKKEIVVSDDGDGMSYKDIQDKFLIIGRKRRDDDNGRNNRKGRKITGKKGLGKLALFGIGKSIKIETAVAEEETITTFVLDWEEILKSSGIYAPQSTITEKTDKDFHGTIITLSNLSRKTGFDLYGTAVSLSKLFNWIDSDFNVNISKNDNSTIQLTKELKYNGINKEFEWDVKAIVNTIDSDYAYKDELVGHIVSSKKPIKPDLRGITLYVNGRLANIPSYFGLSEAGHTFSYLSGWIEADYLDEFENDLISTDRQSLSWDMPEAEELKVFLQKIIRFIVNDWSNKRKQAKQDRTSQRSGINVREWIDTVPDDLKHPLDKLLNTMSDKSGIDDEEFSGVVRDIYDLIPPYTYFHYRLLHSEIQDAAKSHYISGDYYTALQESIKRYKNAVKDKSGVADCEDLSIVSNSFGKGKPLRTTAKYQFRPNGNPFSEDTLNNIEEGQLALSRGIVSGGRNVVSHEEHKDLMESGLFTEKDCLDLLGLLSHLFKRLDESEKQQ